MIQTFRFVALLVTSLSTIMVFAGLDRAHAQQEPRPSICQAIASAPGPLIWKASLKGQAKPVSLADQKVRITYATHSTFRIETPEGVIIATDYAGRHGTGRLPDVVTMNRAHSTHWTPNPHPDITHVLPGWGEGGAEKADHYIQVKDVLIRNVTSDIYRGGTLVAPDGNSIFVFEAAGLCIGHVGHLHHTLTPDHIARIGRIDVLMLPVDGGYTLSIPGVSELAKTFRSSLILPMHWFSTFSLQRFIGEARDTFEVEIARESAVEVSLNALPAAPKVMVLPPEVGGGFDFGSP